MQKVSPFGLMKTVFIGLLISLTYMILGATLLFFLEGKSTSQLFLVAYSTSFKTLISLGLALGTTMIVFRHQGVIPDAIETAFKGVKFPESYLRYKERFVSRRRSVTFAAQFTIVGLFIFLVCQFPLPSRLAEALMIIPACAQYAAGVYVGRKLIYLGMMLHSLQDITVTRNLFKARELDEINSYVHIVATLTVICVYIHILGYHEGPFWYKSVFGQSAKIFLLLPALIATPVLLIFNFYPRVVLKRIYDQSIDAEIKSLRETLQNEDLSSFEKKSYLLEFDRMSREELRYSLQLTLSDLPIGITILIMVLEPLLDK